MCESMAITRNHGTAWIPQHKGLLCLTLSMLDITECRRGRFSVLSSNSERCKWCNLSSVSGTGMFWAGAEMGRKGSREIAENCGVMTSKTRFFWVDCSPFAIRKQSLEIMTEQEKRCCFTFYQHLLPPNHFFAE